MKLIQDRIEGGIDGPSFARSEFEVDIDLLAETDLVKLDLGAEKGDGECFERDETETSIIDSRGDDAGEEAIPHLAGCGCLGGDGHAEQAQEISRWRLCRQLADGEPEETAHERPGLARKTRDCIGPYRVSRVADDQETQLLREGKRANWRAQASRELATLREAPRRLQPGPGRGSRPRR